MASTFTGYSIAVSGMFVNQSALSVVSSNLSNLDTTGYSRKQINSSEQTINLLGNKTAGTGVRVAEVLRARDIFLDQTYRRQNAKAGYWGVKASNLESAQETLNEFSADDGTSANGLQQTLQEFFDSWSELSKDPGSQSNRQVVVEYARELVSTLQEIDQQLEQLQLDGVKKVEDAVATLNDLAKQVAELNSQITRQELSGVEAGDLRDQRDQLLDEMSGLANITVQEHSNGVLEVSINGVSLVRGNETRTLEVSGDGTTDNPLKVQWADLGYEAEITSGSIKAYLEDSDQSDIDDITTFPYDFSTGATSSISDLRQGLNVLLTTIAEQINALHTSGVDLDGNAGLDFFIAVDSTQPLSLSNIQVNPALDDPDLIVASASGAAGDNTIAEAIYNLTGEDIFLFDGLATDLNGFYESLISWVATAGDDASGYYDTQSALAQNLDNQRQSISSVSMDEEMTKMIMYQNVYNANAKVLSTIDSLLEGLIADLGSRLV